MDIRSLITWFTNNYKRWYICLVIATITAVAALVLGRLQFMRDMELTTLDYRFVKFPIPDEVASGIVLVDIDNSSLTYFMEQAGIQYPFPRSYYAIMTEMFSEVGVKAVLYDMLFYDPDLNREETSAVQTDGQFAAAIRRNGRVSLGMEFLVDSTRKTPDISAFSVPVQVDDISQTLQYTGALVPIDTLREAASSLGVTNIRTDGDGVVRHVQLLHEYRGSHYPSFPLAGWMIGEQQEGFAETGSFVRAGGLDIPVNTSGDYLVNWYGQGGPDGVFNYVTISSVIQTAIAERYGGTPSLDPGIFEGKYVIVGASASGLKDLKPTPFTSDYAYPGMEIWATVLSNILQADFVQRTPGWLVFLHVLLISFVTVMVFTRFAMRYSTPLILVILGYVVFLPVLLWIGSRIWLPIATPTTGFLLSYVVIALTGFLVEGRSKMELRRVFTRYVHPDVIQNLMQHPDMIQLGGDEIWATVLFSDIYDFTSFSEGKSAPELVGYLNEYFTTLTGFVLDHHGLLDKYTGDGIMAIFGAPIHREDHAVLACQAALDHRRYSEAQQSSGRELSPPEKFHIHTRIGLNSGLIVAGNIGSERRTDYTAIGDDVNLAARLEGVNKVFRTQIIISESTYDLVRDAFICRELDMLRVKGKEEPVKIYELITSADQEAEMDFELIDQYHQGLEEYRLGNWERAMGIFGYLADGAHRDPVAKTMLERCLVLKDQQPEEWDGVFTLKTK